MASGVRGALSNLTRLCALILCSNKTTICSIRHADRQTEGKTGRESEEQVHSYRGEGRQVQRRQGCKQVEKQAGREIDMQAVEEANRQAGTQAGGKTGKQKDVNIDRHAPRQINRHPSKWTHRRYMQTQTGRWQPKANPFQETALTFCQYTEAIFAKGALENRRG